jgi:hypothetical protein
MRLINPAYSDILVVMIKRAAHFGQKLNSPGLKTPTAFLSPDLQQATGNRQQATGNRQQATGNRQQATGNRQQATLYT